MLEGLKRLIFNTDIDDVSEEGELEEIQLPKKEAEPEPEPVKKTQPAPQPQQEAKAEPAEPAEEPFTGIVADEEKQKAASRNERKGKSEPRAARQKKDVYAEANAEFEFKPILSPIYGNTADEERKPQDVHDAVHLPKAKTRTALNTVISPMYGADQPRQKQKSKTESNPPRHGRISAKEEPQEKVLSLDEMLVKEKKDEREETVQISLFGETTPVHAEKEDQEKVYLVDEEE